MFCVDKCLSTVADILTFKNIKSTRNTFLMESIQSIDNAKTKPLLIIFSNYEVQLIDEDNNRLLWFLLSSPM